MSGRGITMMGIIEDAEVELPHQTQSTRRTWCQMVLPYSERWPQVTLAQIEEYLYVHPKGHSFELRHLAHQASGLHRTCSDLA